MTSLPSNLSQWLAYIDAGHSSEIELGLDRIRPVAEQLELLEDYVATVVTVAGTNGKGSTVAMLQHIAAAHGYRVGTYTSPHFLHYNERVSIDGQGVDDEGLCQAFSAVEDVRQRTGVTLTYFEYGTLAALWLFRQQPLDLIVLEVGLGGRLDAVNLIDADVAVVTTVALDHQSWLGTDREAIGREKAGICRTDRPLIYGEADMPQSVVTVAADVGAQLIHWGEDFHQSDLDGYWCWRGLDALGNRFELDRLPYTHLPHPNAATAIQALAMAGISLDAESVHAGLRQASLPGRMQRLTVNSRHLLLDVAHNPHAAGYLASRLSAVAGHRWSIVGMLNDKDIKATLAALKPVVDRWLVVDLPTPRAASAAALAGLLAGAAVERFQSVADALAYVLANSGEEDEILVTGSFFTVSAALVWIGDGHDGSE